MADANTSETPTLDNGGPGPVEGEVVSGAETFGDADESGAIEEPAKVMRIGSMIRTLLEEVRQADLDPASRDRMREIYEQSVAELSSALSPDLREELERFTLPFDESTPSESELRIAQAQLVGWLEGLFHGIQAAVVAQQMMAQRQLQEMRQGAIGPGQTAPHGAGPTNPQGGGRPGGVYL
ncbi:MAG: hypothetical protein ACI8Y4_000732 [Candidatus Poriferisodalaceae bacterium]|jgi:hypothetical protein